MVNGGFKGTPSTTGGMWKQSDALYGGLGFRQRFFPVAATGGTITTSIINNELYNIHTFSYTGSDQTFSVSNIGSLGYVEVYMWGGAGGGANAEGYSDSGGPGGYAYGILSVKNFLSSSILVQVGSGGGVSSGGTSRPTRPYPAGGLPALRTGYICGAGGGRSGLFISSISAANALLIAGGGGGGAGHGGGGTTAANGTTGGGGGGSTGGGARSVDGSLVTNGGTQSSPGSYQNTGLVGTAPAQLQGGDAGNGTNFGSGGWNSAGGGGDGWYGGGCQEAHVGGGGGSGYYHPSFVTNASLQATTVGSGKVSSTNPPQTGSTYYSSGIGVGNANAAGGNGKVVIVYKIASA